MRDYILAGKFGEGYVKINKKGIDEISGKYKKNVKAFLQPNGKRVGVSRKTSFQFK